MPRLFRAAVVLVALVVLATAIGFTAFERISSENVSFRMAKLRGTFVRVGQLSSWDYGDPVYGVRLRATLCFEPDARAVESYPLEFQVAHYALRSQASSWGEPFRTVTDNANWIVPFGELGFDNGCQDVVVEDVLPDEDYKGVEGDLGSMLTPPSSRSGTDPIPCYGVELKVAARFLSEPPVERDAGGRTIVRCGSLFE